jgi:hypothetical protein
MQQATLGVDVLMGVRLPKPTRHSLSARVRERRNQANSVPAKRVGLLTTDCRRGTLLATQHEETSGSTCLLILGGPTYCCSSLCPEKLPLIVAVAFATNRGMACAVCLLPGAKYKLRQPGAVTSPTTNKHDQQRKNEWSVTQPVA